MAGEKDSLLPCYERKLHDIVAVGLYLLKILLVVLPSFEEPK